MEIAGNLKPSARGELEITDVNLEYLHRGQLQVVPLEKDFTWLDAGTADSLLDAGRTIKEIQDETGRYVGCLEELGLQEGWIDQDHVHAIGDELSMTCTGNTSSVYKQERGPRGLFLNEGEENMTQLVLILVLREEPSGPVSW